MSDFNYVIEDINDIPKSKLREGGGVAGDIAQNSGVVKLRAVINRKCPFMKTNAFQDVLIFNSQSMRGFPTRFRNMLSTVPGTEGVFLKPRIVYRHNFISAKEDITARDVYDDLPIRGLSLSDNIRLYKDEQTWVIDRPLFSDKFLRPKQYNITNDQSECEELCKWEYALEKREFTDPEGQAVLVPKQIVGTVCGTTGVHWHLLKKTPMFKGEDFFVEFNMSSESVDIPENLEISNSPFQGRYETINVRSKKTFFSTTEDGTRKQLFSNKGVVSYDSQQNPIDDKTNDFSNQSYFIIEIGVEDPDHNYMIIITERGNPRFVRVTNDRSYFIDEFSNGFNVSSNSANNKITTIKGSSLISSDWFRVEVRNHLGKFIIKFIGPSFESNEWVIERVDEKPADSTANAVVGYNPPTVPKPVIMFVPQAALGLWGGNIKCGFSFGPIQYEQPNSSGQNSTSLSFLLPALPDESNSSTDVSLEATQGNLLNLNEEKKYEYFSLPAGVPHTISLESTDKKISELLEYEENTGRNKYLFTQDAQVFEWVNNNRKETTLSNFFYGPSLRALTDDASFYSRLRVEKVNVIQDPSNRAEQFKLRVSLKAGSHVFPSGWVLPSCKTPVLTLINLKSPVNDQRRWSVEPIDVSEHILSYTDSWSAQDFSKIDHTGHIKFLLNEGATYDNDETYSLVSLVNKAFYIEVWAGYSSSENESPSVAKGCNYSKIPGFYKLFTGICYGGTITREVGKRVMECQISDYTQVLQEMMFFNSPFFDGVRDFNAVHEILNYAGFMSEDDDDPGRIVRTFAENTESDFFYGVGPDGRPVVSRMYVLPSAYAKLSQPFFKFEDGSKLYDAIIGFAKRAGKLFFFDAYGVAHYDSYLDFDVIGQIVGLDNSANQQGCSSESPDDPLPTFWYTTNPSRFRGQMAYDSVTAQRTVTDVYNHTKLLTNTPNGEVIWSDDLDWSSVEDPSKEGFIGYLKTLYQREGVFGSKEAARNTMLLYRAMRRPPLVLSFQSFGQPVRALDLIRFDGQLARVMKVDHSIDPTKNTWWNNFECEWLYPINTTVEQSRCP